MFLLFFSYLQFMDLRTRYTALLTLMTQYIKFAGDSLKRLEEEEVTIKYEHLTEKEVYSMIWKNKNGFMVNLYG